MRGESLTVTRVKKEEFLTKNKAGIYPALFLYYLIDFLLYFHSRCRH